MLQNRKLTIKYTEVEDKTKWSTVQLELIETALKVAKNAHAPYSNFLVGATALLEDGSIISASNQENAAYPSGMCAERVLMYFINANHPEAKIEKLVIVAHPRGKENLEIVSPCGACRQVLNEYNFKYTPNFELILATTDLNKGYIFNSVKDILPFSFSSEALFR